MKRLVKLTLFLLFLMVISLNNTVVSFASEYAETVNLSTGKPYTNVRVVSSYFPDTDNKELTDGVFGTKIYLSDPAWTGVAHRETASGMVYDEWPLYTTVIDLEKVCSITEVSANFVRDLDLRIGFPGSVKVYASLDNENWQKLCYTNFINDHIPDGIYSFGWNVPDVEPNHTVDLACGDVINARYVRFDFETRADMTLIDEITVMGYDGVVDFAEDPYNIRKLENGTIMRSGEPTGRVTDLVLLNYTPTKFWSKESYLPYLAYLDADGNVKDTLFDTVCLVANMGPNGRVFDVENDMVTIDDWKWYLDRTFVGENSEYNILNETAKQVSFDLNDPDYRVKLVVMMPYPPAGATNFGTLNGKKLDLSVEEDWKYAVDWYLKEVFNYIKSKDDYIDFCGFYWINEYPNQMERIIYANSQISKLGCKSYWIPYFHSAGYLANETLGFDAITLQPNHFFSDSTGNTLGAGGTKIVETVAKLGAYADFGVEFEFDLRLDTDVNAYNRFLDYLNTAANMGYQGPGYFRNWYEAGGGVYGVCYSKAPEIRMLYDNIYEVIKGNYESREYIEKLNDNLLLNKPYTHNGTKWYTDRSNDAKCVYLTDGEVNGSFYGNNYFGLEQEDAAIEFEFEETSLKEIHIIAFKDLNAGVNLPKNIKISAKQNGEWKVIYDGEYPDSLRAVFTADTKIKTSGLRFEFERKGGFLFLKEIMAYEENNAVKFDADLISPCVLGDVTGDGVINSTDVLQINRKIANLSSLFDLTTDRELRLKAADVTGDTIINGADVLQINRKIANLSSILDK